MARSRPWCPQQQRSWAVKTVSGRSKRQQAEELYEGMGRDNCRVRIGLVRSGSCARTCPAFARVRRCGARCANVPIQKQQLAAGLRVAASQASQPASQPAKPSICKAMRGPLKWPHGACANDGDESFSDIYIPASGCHRWRS